MLKVHSFETMGALDGPGVRTVIFLSGCPMRCVYCHNPDMFLLGNGIEMSIDELLRFALRYKSYYGSEGGVTLSGGEPLMQADGVTELLLALKKEGIHTALDTSGCIFSKAAIDAADLVILDIKHTSKEGFFKVTGADISNTLKTLDYLKQSKKRFWIRQVIVKGYTDTVEQVKMLKELANGAERIELLPYHAMGEKKYEANGLPYPLKGKGTVERDMMLRLNEALERT